MDDAALVSAVKMFTWVFAGFYLQSVIRETETLLVHKLKLSLKYDVIARH